MTRERMTALLKQYVHSCCLLRPHSINAAMAPRLVSCSPEEGWVELEYDAGEWMRNLRGTVHGGAVCALLDNAMGALAWCRAEGSPCPTVSMNTSFVRPIEIGTVLRARARYVSAGRTLTHTEAKLWVMGAESRVLASGTAVYLIQTPSATES